MGLFVKELGDGVFKVFEFFDIEVGEVYWRIFYKDLFYYLDMCYFGKVVLFRIGF